MMRSWFPIFREVKVIRLMEISTLMKKAPSRTIVILQSLHHDSVGHQYACIRVGLTKKAKFLQMQLRTQARIRKNTTALQMKDYTRKVWVSQTVKTAKLFIID
jgi:hypothetical protein